MKKVLIVDDETMIRTLVRRSLELHGFAVFESASGQEALDRFDAGEVFDLLIIDMLMPVMDGNELIHRVLAGPIRSTPIMLLSACIGELRKDLRGQLGSVREKPITPSELVGEVKRLIGE